MDSVAVNPILNNQFKPVADQTRVESKKLQA